MSDASDPGSTPTLAEVQARVADVEGWLTDAQIQALHEAARACPPGGRIVEIGSFRGRSTVVLASSAPVDVEIVAIDPHAGNDRGPQEIEGFEAEAATDHEVFNRNLADAGVAERVRHVRAFSDVAHGDVTDPIDVLFIDGAHRFGPARADIRDWGARVAPGGRMLIHDSFSSIGVTLAILVELLVSPEWRYDGRAGSLTSYRRTHQSPGARGTSALRQLAQLPWFARNVAIKVLMVTGRHDWARKLGHDGETWPY
ncbi:class I SAM-dependent methyltransferase [Acidimicrobiia bacterium EGI L10123]|uniref:class I SAM-dependent methyltransferase n=1 Tax=Salinilacustrithrix flava TaxID=2957203 RepID=UPI003D7C2CD7|nr:class I SAM-dependent methyltransferase [Acidimicrobiia bacterium EGI L10123]